MVTTDSRVDRHTTPAAPWASPPWRCTYTARFEPTGAAAAMNTAVRMSWGRKENPWSRARVSRGMRHSRTALAAQAPGERNIFSAGMFPSSTPKITMATGPLQAATAPTAFSKSPGSSTGRKYSNSPSRKASTRGFFKSARGRRSFLGAPSRTWP